MQVEILRVEKSSDGSSTDRSRSLVDETPPHLAWSESWLQLAVVPEVEIWTYTGALGQLSWPKMASTVRYRLNRKWKYGGNMRNRFPVHGFLFDPITSRGLSVTVLSLLMGDGYLKNSKSRHFSYKFRKKLVSTDMFQMTWIGLKREKNTLLRYPNSVGLSRFSGPG